jgi:Calcineurin-like phosphoesterase
MMQKWKTHYDEYFEQVDNYIRGLFDEVVAGNENLDRFVYAKLKLSCFELFKGFSSDNQQQLLEVVDRLIYADGVVHPNEQKFRDELRDLLKAETPIALDDKDIEQISASPLKVEKAAHLTPAEDNHPLLEHLERHYSRNPELFQQQLSFDYDLITQTLFAWDEQRKKGQGRLDGVTSVAALAGTPPFLDRHIYSLMPGAKDDLELVVFGDLHGCYSCLKGGLMQADFFKKVQAYRNDPTGNPDIKLVFLGDYVDRGMFSFNGILRTVMQLFVSMPEHVYILRGNHEYYLSHSGKIVAGVRPAEAISTLEPYMPTQMFQAYMMMFESMPNMLLFDRTLFVHAGIPRDETSNARYRDLGSLNDPEIRFQMLWSDPSRSNYIPAELQRENARFPFGKSQFREFMNRLGTNSMVRGHEKVDEGFKKIFDEPDCVLMNLFSAGGSENNDLPPGSSYRSVTPMALTLRWKHGELASTPWEIDWRTYQNPAKNAFYRSPPEIAFKHG